jgi:peptide-methionine (S)-S-oxide reductase
MFAGFTDPNKLTIPSKNEALTGRDTPMSIHKSHAVFGTPLQGPWPAMAEISFGMGCFWGAERKFWVCKGVVSTAVGYAAGHTKHPNYEEVCSGRTGHNEVVRVIYDPKILAFESLLSIFWENHNPTQGMRQGNDVGTQYRSGIYWSTPDQESISKSTNIQFQSRLTAGGFGGITTEIIQATTFYFAEEHHQQYLHKNPGGYCGLGGCFSGQ